MRIEFQTIGDGTNIEVLLIDEIEPGLGIVKRFYTCAHGFECRITEPITEEWFVEVYSLCPPPIIGGQFARFHPYWKDHPEQKEKVFK